MANHKYYQDEEIGFSINVDLDVVITSLSTYSEISEKVFNETVKNMVDDGSLSKFIKDRIVCKLNNEVFDEYVFDQIFDRIVFEIVNVK